MKLNPIKFIKSKISHKNENKGEVNNMSHKVVGGVECKECGTNHQETMIMEISPDDENTRTLIWCEECQGWKYWR